MTPSSRPYPAGNGPATRSAALKMPPLGGEAQLGVGIGLSWRERSTSRHPSRIPVRSGVWTAPARSI